MSNIGKIALHLTYVRDQIKFYHWSTEQFSRHTASDKLVNNLTDDIDKFIEAMMGSENKKLFSLPNDPIIFVLQDDNSIVDLLQNFKIWLTSDLISLINTKNTDLINIRDNILQNVNITLYLFTLL